MDNSKGPFIPPGPPSSCDKHSDSQFQGTGCGDLSPYSRRSPVDTVVLLKDSPTYLCHQGTRKRNVCVGGTLCEDTQGINRRGLGGEWGRGVAGRPNFLEENWQQAQYDKKLGL